MTQKSQKKPAWRIAAFVMGVAAIAFMWAGKDVAGSFEGMSAAEALPVAAVSIAVTLVKVALMTGAVLLIKWPAGKIKK